VRRGGRVVRHRRRVRAKGIECGPSRARPKKAGSRGRFYIHVSPDALPVLLPPAVVIITYRCCCLLLLLGRRRAGRQRRGWRTTGQRG